MNSLYNYITETAFTNKDFIKHDYAQRVIDKILSSAPIRLGANGERGEFILDTKEIDSIKNQLEKVRSVEEFNKIIEPYGIKWSSIFKGDFSGYSNGLTSKNKGNMFELEFINHFEDYKDDLAKSLGLTPSKFDNCIPILKGGQNQRRPLTKDGDKIMVGGKHSTVGESVVDVYVEDIDGNPYYLSLKYGETVTFCNVGVSQIFTKKSFDRYESTGDYVADTYNGVNGQELLDLFCIDANKFADVFVNYSHGTLDKGKDYINITKDLKSNKKFYHFIESVVGYGYVLVHKIGNKIHYLDLRTEKDMRDFIGRVESAEIQYGGVSGGGKRIDIVVELTNMTIKFNIRNKQSGIFPSHIMADYKIK